MINYSKLFDLARDTYADLSYHSRSGRALIPLRYFFELTYRCNLACPYCYVGQDRRKNELTTDEWKSVINQIPFYAFVTLVGGEPLVRKDFVDILYSVSKKTLGKVNVVSNGILMNEDIVDAFIKSQMVLLSVSLDGYGVNHDKNRGTDGIWDKIIANLAYLQERKKELRKSKPMIDIKTIVLENNLDDLPKLYKLCNEMKFDFLSISFLRNNNLKQNSCLRESFGEEFWKQEYPINPYFDMAHFEEVYKEISSLSKKSKVQIRYSPKFDGGDELAKIKKFFSEGPNKEINEIYYPCKYPYSNMMINPQGDVYPCLSLNIGNVKNMGLKEVYNLPKFRCFRKNLQCSKLFTSCQMCCELKVKE